MELKDRISENLSYSNLTNQNFDIRKIYKKINSNRNELIFTQSNSIRLILEQIINYIKKKGYMTLDHKAHPTSEFHMKNKQK